MVEVREDYRDDYPYKCTFDHIVWRKEWNNATGLVENKGQSDPLSVGKTERRQMSVLVKF